MACVRTSGRGGLSIEVKAMIRWHWAAGDSQARIAMRCGVSVGCVAGLIHREGLARRVAVQPEFTGDPLAGLMPETAAACRYLAMGWPVEDVADAMDVAATWVAAVARVHARRVRDQRDELARDDALLADLAAMKAEGSLAWIY